MRSFEQVDEVLSLVDRGLNDCEVSRVSGVPRSTVRRWRHHGHRMAERRIDLSCPACGHATHCFGTLVNPSYAYLLGLYLGDGCISVIHRGVFKLQIYLDAKYLGILEECEAAMRAVMPANRAGRRTKDGCVEIGSYSKAWPCLFPQHGPGRKHERPIVLAEWQDWVVECYPGPFLRGLIHSDGCRGTNTVRSKSGKAYRYPRYQFSNRSLDIQRIFTDACDRLEIEWRQMNQWNISVARRDSVARMDEFVGPKA